MADQNYFIAGLDLSSISAPTQSEIMQAINGMTPLTNIGLVIVGTVRPDITNNPEMINSIWLDITDPALPVFKRYIASRTVLVDADPSWTAEGVSTGSILTAMLAARSTTGGVDVARIKANSGYTDSGNYYYLLRIAANGKDVEAVTLDTALADGGGVALSRLATSGSGTGKYLKTVAGALSYGYIDPAVDITSTIGNRIPASSIAPGDPFSIMMTNSAGTAVQFSAAAAIEDGTLPLDSLQASGAATGDIIRFDGAEWDNITPSIDIASEEAANLGMDFGVMGAAVVFNENHGLGAVPKIIRAVAICVTADNGFVTGDELDIHSISLAGAPSVGVSADATEITVTLASAAGNVIPNKGTGVYAAMTEANWRIKVYAWK